MLSWGPVKPPDGTMVVPDCVVLYPHFSKTRVIGFPTGYKKGPNRPWLSVFNCNPVSSTVMVPSEISVPVMNERANPETGAKSSLPANEFDVRHSVDAIKSASLRTERAMTI